MRYPQSHCKRGHELIPENSYTKSNGTKLCRICSRERHRRWRKRNPDKVRSRNLPRLLRWIEENPKRNTRSNLQRLREWRAQHPERVRTQMREIRRRYRARKRQAAGNFQPWMTRYYRYVQQSRCIYCGVLMYPDLPRNHPHKESLEHLIPLSRGGLHSWENTVLACLACNHKKNDKTPDEFRSVVSIS